MVRTGFIQRALGTKKATNFCSRFSQTLRAVKPALRSLAEEGSGWSVDRMQHLKGSKQIPSVKDKR